MSKRTVLTNITPLPDGVTRELAVAGMRGPYRGMRHGTEYLPDAELHDHRSMIDLNPLVINRFTIKPPAFATAEEYHCTWYQIEDQISYLPGVKGKVAYHACFHDMPDGLQTHIYAPMGLNIRSKWTVAGSMPGEPAQPVELGLNIPKRGLYLREDVDMKSTIGTTSFIKKNLSASHKKLVDRFIEKTKLEETRIEEARLSVIGSSYASSQHSSAYSPNLQSALPAIPAIHAPASGRATPPAMVRLPDGRIVEAHHFSPYASPHFAHVDPAFQSMNPYRPESSQPYAHQPAFEMAAEPVDPNKKAKLPQSPVEMQG